MSEIKELAEAMHELAIEKGWWQTARGVPELLNIINPDLTGMEGKGLENTQR